MFLDKILISLEATFQASPIRVNDCNSMVVNYFVIIMSPVLNYVL